jgi:hypothetical protein
MTPDSVILQLQKRTGMKDYVIGDKLHGDGGRHFYVILISNKKVDVRSATKFDREFEGKSCRCNCTAIKNLFAVVCMQREQPARKTLESSIALMMQLLATTN